METTITKYVVIRTTWSSAKCSYVRTVKRFDDEAEAIDWAERHSTRDHIACRVFTVECKVKEDGTVCYPCDWSKNALPSVSVENVGTLIYRKQGKEVHDFRESKETCANAEENSANANAEPVMSEWRVSSNGWGEDKSYQVYRRIDVNATDHSGNRENRGGVFDNRAEAQAYADKLKALTRRRKLMSKPKKRSRKVLMAKRKRAECLPSPTCTVSPSATTRCC